MPWQLTLALSTLALQLFGKKWRVGAMLATFLLSAIAHEYIVAFGLGIFCPILFCNYTIFGGELTTVPSTATRLSPVP